MLEIKDLHAEIDGKPILKGVNLKINEGEIHVVMGPNGAGKSTLAKTIAGHPSIEVTKGSISFYDNDLLDMDPETRANKGVFLSFQYPPEIRGVSTFQFLKEAYKAKYQKEIQDADFSRILEEKMALLNMPLNFKERDLNEGFSGGEKKKSEILQMAVLEPSLAILDETDSGLDIDAMKTVATGIKKLLDKKKSLLVITHYQRLLNYLNPDVIHIFMDGKIVSKGGSELASILEESGYEHVPR